MTQDLPLSLPLAEWCVCDRDAWNTVTTQTDDPFSTAPAVSKWGLRTRNQARLALGRLMRWLISHDYHFEPVGAGRVLTETLFLRYLKDELKRQKIATATNEALLLIGGLGVIAPEVDYSWTKPFIRRMSRRAHTEPLAHRMIAHSAVLYDAGLQEMLSADAETLNPNAYRDGLCVALLAAIPIRIKNFADLEIGRHLIAHDQGWRIALSAAETKTNKEDIWPFPLRLKEQLEYYLTTIRPHLLDMAKWSESARLWIGPNGGPVTEQTVRKWITRVSTKHLGHAVLPHSFRHSAATTLTFERPSKIVEAQALLGHRSSATTERHYIMHQAAEAGAYYHTILNRIM